MIFCIEVNNLNKCFGEKKVLENLSVKIEKGAIVSIVGGNGIGKSVFLNCLLNFMEYDGGEIRILNVTNQDHNFLRTNTSFISIDNQQHIEKVTPKEYFDLIISIYNLDERAKREEYTFLANELNVISNLDVVFSSLSFGTKKKVQLIGGILYNPPLLVCDEIFEGLDHDAVNWVKLYFQKRKNTGHTTLFTTHIMEHTLDISTNIYRLENGKLTENLHNH